MAAGSKKKIRDLMHILYEHAIRYEWTDRNPTSAVRQGGQRQSTPVRLIEELLAWRQKTAYAEDGDYVFATPKMKGRQPYWMSRIMQHHIKPAAAQAGIASKGWHTLRHSYTTLLRQNNNDPKVVQGLLRHNSIRVTMDIYDEAVSAEKQMAHQKVLRLVTRKQDRTVMRTASERGIAASA
jgi:site-specific recombinase XerD